MLLIINKLKDSLEKTRSGFTSKIRTIFQSHKGLSDDILEELEEILILADIGIETTANLIDVLRTRFEKDKDIGYEQVVDVLKEEILSDISPLYRVHEHARNGKKPYVILVIGVNGTGKTTSIGKLAHYYKSRGKRVLLAAADTFRAAAIEQLEVWKNRSGVELIKMNAGADPGAAAYDSAQAAVARDIDILIVDTAGRIHTNSNLMQELAKIKRVLGKVIPGAPHKTLLVIDANMGQNAVSQARLFTEAIKVDGLFLSKLDGTAKGGAVIPIMKQLQIPIEFVGIGEQKEDIQLFNIKEFTDALFL